MRVTKLSRRTALGSALSGLASLQAGSLSAARRTRRLGIADLTIKRELHRDYAGTLNQIAGLGYRDFSFELSGYAGREPGEPTPRDKARMARDAGLGIGPVGLRVFNSDPDRELDDALGAGASIVVAPPALPFITGPKRFEASRSAFEAWLPTIVSLAEKAKARGLVLAYHNHWFDHAPLDGESSLEILARHLPPSMLSFEIDFANAWYAGIAPLDLIRRLGSRVVAMHWKDIDRSKGDGILRQVATPGDGDMDYAALVPLVLHSTKAPAFVEVDDPDDGIEAARRAAKLLLPTMRG